MKAWKVFPIYTDDIPVIIMADFWDIQDGALVFFRKEKSGCTERYEAIAAGLWRGITIAT